MEHVSPEPKDTESILRKIDLTLCTFASKAYSEPMPEPGQFPLMQPVHMYMFRTFSPEIEPEYYQLTRQTDTHASRTWKIAELPFALHSIRAMDHAKYTVFATPNKIFADKTEYDTQSRSTAHYLINDYFSAQALASIVAGLQPCEGKVLTRVQQRHTRIRQLASKQQPMHTDSNISDLRPHTPNAE